MHVTPTPLRLFSASSVRRKLKETAISPKARRHRRIFSSICGRFCLYLKSIDIYSVFVLIDSKDTSFLPREVYLSPRKISALLRPFSLYPVTLSHNKCCNLTASVIRLRQRVLPSKCQMMNGRTNTTMKITFGLRNQTQPSLLVFALAAICWLISGLVSIMLTSQLTI